MTKYRKEKHYCYKGYVVEIDEDTVHCHFEDINTGIEYECEVYKHKMPNGFEVGSILKWSFGLHRKGGKLQRYSKMQKKKMKPWTAKQLKRFSIEASQIADKIKWLCSE